MLDLATSYNPHRENHQRNCSKIRRHGVKTERFYINYTLPYLINIHPMNPKNIQNLNKIPYPFSYLTLPLKLGRGEERRGEYVISFTRENSSYHPGSFYRTHYV